MKKHQTASDLFRERVAKMQDARIIGDQTKRIVELLAENARLKDQLLIAHAVHAQIPTKASNE